MGGGCYNTVICLLPKISLTDRRNQTVARPLLAHRTVQTQNKRTQTSMPEAGFEHTIPVFERAKTVHALG
jgi:hypothetical protein